MSEIAENPQVLYVPINPGSSEDWYMNFLKQKVREGAFDAAIIETYMSGGVCGVQPYEGLSLISEASLHIPTFLVPQAPQQQKYPRRYEGPELCGGIALETAYSGIADQVVAKVIEALKSSANPEEVIQKVRGYFRQTEWPPPAQQCGKCGKCGTWGR